MICTIKEIQLAETFDGNYGKQLSQEIAALIQAGTKTVLLNCESLTFMDSSGLGALVVIFKQLQQVQGKLALCLVNPQIQLLFEITNLDSVFTIFVDRQAFEQSGSVI